MSRSTHMEMTMTHQWTTTDTDPPIGPVFIKYETDDDEPPQEYEAYFDGERFRPEQGEKVVIFEWPDWWRTK